MDVVATASDRYSSIIVKIFVQPFVVRFFVTVELNEFIVNSIRKYLKISVLL